MNKSSLPPEPFNRVGVFTKPLNGRPADGIHRLLDFFDRRGLPAVVDERTAEQAGRGDIMLAADEIPDAVDLIIVLGGDGTMLAVARRVGVRRVPLLGINFGSLGFLTGTPQDRMLSTLDDVLRGEYRVEERMKLDVSVVRGGCVVETHQALNDAVINKSALARIIDMEVFIGSSLLSHYKADGLITATPTGSTAYSLSAGGPIVVPTSRNLILSPICPHTLTHRPLVLDSRYSIRIRYVSGEGVMVTVDGQVGCPLELGDELVVSESKAVTRLVIPEGQSFFDVLRQKLKWGER